MCADSPCKGNSVLTDFSVVTIVALICLTVLAGMGALEGSAVAGVASAAILGFGAVGYKTAGDEGSAVEAAALQAYIDVETSGTPAVPDFEPEPELESEVLVDRVEYVLQDFFPDNHET